MKPRATITSPPATLPDARPRLLEVESATLADTFQTIRRAGGRVTRLERIPAQNAVWRLIIQWTQPKQTPLPI